MRVETSGAQAPVAVSVIIVNWNSKDYLRQCLTSLYRHCTKTVLEIIVVDGASFDGCGEMLAKEFPLVIFIQSEKNVGFAKANNLGARSARGDFLLLLNPDTEFIEDSIATLTQHLATVSNTGATGCKLLNQDHSLQTSCVMAFPTPLNQALDSEFLRSRFPNWKMWGTGALYALPEQTAIVEVISGACILITRALYERIGGFTESYFMYSEDVDLCLKIKRAGLAVYYVPATRLIHFGGASSGKAPSNFSNVMMRQSIYDYFWINHSHSKARAYRCAMFLTALVRLLLTAPPLFFNRRFVREGPNSAQKWYAIFKWSIGVQLVGASVARHKTDAPKIESLT